MGWTKGSVAALSLFVMLSGCALTDVFHRSDSRVVDEEFEVSGRMAIKLGDEGSSVKINWTHRRDVDAVDIYSPVGSVVAVILVSPRTGAVIETKDDLFEAPTAEELTEKVLGWHFPLEGMKYWVRGDVNPNTMLTKSNARDPIDRLTYFEQDGWTIAYEKFMEDTKLPKIISLGYDDLKIRFVIDKWTSLDRDE